MTCANLQSLLTSFLSAGERGRSVRSESLVGSVRSLRSIRTRKKGIFQFLQAQVRAQSINGWYTVTIRPQKSRDGWSWTCTCEDASRATHGPCKHALAVARAASTRINNHVQQNTQ